LVVGFSAFLLPLLSCLFNHLFIFVLLCNHSSFVDPGDIKYVTFGVALDPVSKEEDIMQ